MPSEYSPTYAHTLLMTAKQFISRLAEMRLIPLPGNIRSRRFRFNHSAPAKIETFTVEEVRALLAACDGFSERTKLYLLLMLNCGMYQNDIAELQQRRGELERRDADPGPEQDAGAQRPGRHLQALAGNLRPAEEAPGRRRAGADHRGRQPAGRYWLEDGKMRRYDAIQSAWSRLARRWGGRRSGWA